MFDMLGGFDMIFRMKPNASCKCCVRSPFRWRDDYRPSIFIDAAGFKTLSTGATTSQTATKSVEKKRETDVSYGYVAGVSRATDAEMARNMTYAQHATRRSHKKKAVV